MGMSKNIGAIQAEIIKKPLTEQAINRKIMVFNQEKLHSNNQSER